MSKTKKLTSKELYAYLIAIDACRGAKTWVRRELKKGSYPKKMWAKCKNWDWIEYLLSVSYDFLEKNPPKESWLPLLSGQQWTGDIAYRAERAKLGLEVKKYFTWERVSALIQRAMSSKCYKEEQRVWQISQGGE